MAISGVSGDTTTPVPDANLVNHAFGSGENCGLWRFGFGRLRRPISHAETGETKIPPASPAFTKTSRATTEIGSRFAIQMIAQVSNKIISVHSWSRPLSTVKGSSSTGAVKSNPGGMITDPSMNP